MGDLRSTPHLDLTNFDSPEAGSSRCVLTSPRSLESCARLGVKPVQLLIKSLNQLIAEQHRSPIEAVRVMHQSYESERRRLLRMCREERERIIKEAGDRWPRTSRPQGLLQGSLMKVKPAEDEASVPYADLCSKGKTISRSSCSVAGHSKPGRSSISSFSLGDLKYSPATERRLEKLTRDIARKMHVTVPEKDRKIAALMLVKHQEEQEQIKLSLQVGLQRAQARRREEDQRSQAEVRRRKKLKQSVQRWQEELAARRRVRVSHEKEKVVQLEREMLQQEDRWRRLKEEVEAQRREKTVSALKEAEVRKSYQEKSLREKEEMERRQREKERGVAMDKEQKAQRCKLLLEMRERKRLQEDNQRELLRHILLKRQVEQQWEEEEVIMRTALEKKLQNFRENRAQVVEARLKELQERAAQEELHSQRAQLRAQLQDIQQLTHRQILVQLSQQKLERAVQHTSAQLRNRALQTQQHNSHRQLCHQRLKDRIQREEEAARRMKESRIAVKEWRRERLRRQREQIQEEALRQARASSYMRERVRLQTQSRTFDRMALEAQLTASISKLKLID
ncbi:uncharacterized protein ACB057_007705 [Neosynchiropus ocellatus]